ncbi:hypothetical protein Cagg_0185 [Chloroflexus aggregans DSM 9485]|uniref:Uncharacterized protein n=1 Tax=Chloroflexus aggregans (strain MD-66 / DSM 9485) TaxID=326427 RepID=B8GCT6_CHLAD|nr:hypothetical protein Cagg_0185 [Chloroflexus aggregans DSM 9485]
MARFLAPLEMTRGAVGPWNDEHCTVLASAASHPPRVLASTALSCRAQRDILIRVLASAASHR